MKNLNSDNVKPLNHIHLIGDELENFYNLGVKDQKNLPSALKSVKNLIASPNKEFKLFEKIVDGGLLILAQKVLSKSKHYRQTLRAYSDGLEIPLLKMATISLIPEIMASIDKWIPSIPTQLMGCSSVFSLNDKGKLMHGRVLDFPLPGSFDKFERGVTYQFKNRPIIWSANSVGMPYPAITAMSSEGITVALHQKFTNEFNYQGLPIFEIIYKMLLECHDKKSILSFLKKSCSLTTWGILIGFSDGEILSIDISGKELYQKEYKVKRKDLIYFNNVPMKKTEKCLPIGIDNYCSMRKITADNKKQQLLKRKKDSYSEMDLIKFLGRPIISKNKTAKKWNLSLCTPTSLQIAVMNSDQGSVLWIPGSAPKLLQDQVQKVENIWEKYQSKIIKSGLTKIDNKYTLGMNSLSKACESISNHQDLDLLHQLQLSMHYFKGTPEELIAKFFYLTVRYLRNSEEKKLRHLLDEFHQLKNRLPHYLRDHALLFIGRIELSLNLTPSPTYNEIKNPQLKKLWKFEKDLPPLALKFLKKLTFPRIDILDVIYTYQKLE